MRRDALSRPTARRPRRYRYNVRLIRATQCYSVQEIADLYSLHPNAVRRWLKQGLRTIDGCRPSLVHGTDLIAFLAARQQARRHHCAPDEMFCMRCRAPRRPARGEVALERQNARQLILRGACELCGTRMNRSGSLDRLAEIELAFSVMTASAHLAETTDPPVPCHLPEGA